MLNLTGRFLQEERGATAIEYSLIAALIFLAIVSSIRGFATATAVMYGNIQKAL